MKQFARSGAGVFVIVLVAWGICFWSAIILHDRTRTFTTDFIWSDKEPSVRISEWAGWADELDAVLRPGASAQVVFDLPIDADERVFLRIETARIAGTDAVLEVARADGSPRRYALSPGVNTFDLSEYLSGPIEVYRIGLTAAVPATAGTAPVQPFTSLEVTTAGPRRVHYGAAAMLWLMGAGAWAGVIWFGVLAAGSLRRVWNQAARKERALLAGALGAALLTGAMHPEWYSTKRFDDARAVSNAGVVWDTAADPDRLYFRSHLRPVYVAAILPVTLIAPMEVSLVQTTPADFERELWRLYDRSGPSFGSRIFPELSLVAYAQFALWMLLLGGIAAQLRMPPAGIAAAVLIAALMYNRVLYNCLTLTWNLLINLAAVAAFLRWRERPVWLTALAAGGLLALAGLTKTTAITTALPLAVLFWRDVAVARRGRRMLLAQGAAMLAGAVLPVVVWYEGFLNGLAAELQAFSADIAALPDVHPEYPLRSLESWAAGIWGMAGVWGAAVVAGLGVAAVRSGNRRGADLFFGLWLAAALVLPLSMPFLFPRFFVYALPACGWFAGRSAEAVWRGLKEKGSGVPPAR